MKKLPLIVLGIVAVLIIAGLWGYSQQPPVTAVIPTPQMAAVNNTLLMTKVDQAKGNYLAAANGLTLYLFDKDVKPGESSCYGGCATTWPPYLQNTADLSTLPENITLVKRTGGKLQYAYKGKPLYYYAKDTKPGDLLGDGVGGVWHLIQP